MKKKQKPKDPEKDEVIKVARRSRFLIRIFSGLLVIIYCWLKLRNVPIGQTIGSISSNIILKTSLILYFLSWVAGTINDTNEQEMVYIVAPNKGKFPIEAYILYILIAFVFGILCYVDSSREFANVLLIFLLLNIVAWQIMIKKLVLNSIRESQKVYKSRDDVVALIKLNIWSDYIEGNWQWIRFSVGMGFILIIFAMAYTSLSEYLHSINTDIPTSTYVSISIILYVLVFEGWIWYRRIKIKLAHSTIDDIILDYELIKKK